MNTGGPAFPVPVANATDGRTHDGGMTLLDWYAGQALAGLMASQIGGGPDDSYATDAYNIATAMLAEKARREAAVKESSTTDRFPYAEKLTVLEAEKRELVQALDTMSLWVPTYCNEPLIAIARAILAKHKGAK